METAHIHAIIRSEEAEDLRGFLQRAASAYGWPREEFDADLELLALLLLEVAGNGESCELASHILRALSFSADSSMALRHLVRFIHAHGDAMGAQIRSLRDNPEHLHFLCSFFSFSAYLSEIAIQQPETLGSLLVARGLNREKDLAQYRAEAGEGLAGIEGREERRAALTVVKKRELLRIGIRELRELGDTPTLCRELSSLAQAIVEVAYHDCLGELIALHGMPINESDGEPTGFCVYAMGKFGAGELNFSSDIDLVFVYDEEGHTSPETPAARRLRNHDFFNKLVRMLAGYINDPNPEGFLFRVDLRLRPDGDDGPLARSRSAYVAYLLGHAALWEKIAYMKARCIAGDRRLAELFDPSLEQFVYTENDPAELLPEIARLKRRIDFERLDHESRELDIKRGRGGIREVEFIVAALQILHNGRWPELRVRPTMDALRLLRDRGLIDGPAAGLLESAYYLYRRIEHTLQMMNENQTHRMPSSEEERRRLALRCGFLDKEEFEETLTQYRSKVRELFAETFETEKEPEGLTLLDTLFGDATPTPEMMRELAHAGLGDGQGFQALRRLALGTAEYSTSTRARQAFGKLLPRILAELDAVALPRQSIHQLDQLLRAARGFSWVYEMCQTHPPILRMFLRTLGFGSLLGRLLAAHPEWLDEIFRNGGLREDRTERALEAEDISFPAREPEEAIQALRRFKQLEGFLITVQEVLAICPGITAARRMTLLAERVLDAVVRITARSVVGGNGLEDLPVRWAVLGLGGLGDRQVHFHGDLDIAFVVEKDGEFRGTRLVEWIDRICQRSINELCSVSPDGQLWKVDARLRPDGASGPLSATLGRYLEYYREEAGLWEWQALTKARAVAGDIEFGNEVLAQLHDMATGMKTEGSLSSEILDMRRRIEGNIRLPRSARLDMKRGPGGVIDVEFLVQYHQLSRPGLARDLFPLTTEDALKRLIEEGWIDGTDGRFIAGHLAHLRVTQRLHRILWETNNDYLPADGEKLDALRRGMADQLLVSSLQPADIAADCRRMREIFLRELHDTTNNKQKESS